MPNKNKTLDELLEEEQTLLTAKEEDIDGVFPKLIKVYEMLYNQIVKDPANEYYDSLEKIKESLIFYLVEYGTYLKTVYRKEEGPEAERMLTKAISKNEHLPIAHYRLGFLAYQKENYAMALAYLQDALHQQQIATEPRYRMNQQQLYNCHLYLSNCGLFIATNANESLEKMKADVDEEAVPNYKLSPLYHMIYENNHQLAAHAYQMITPEKNQLCSKEECEEALDQPNMLILHLSNRENQLLFHSNDIYLSKDEVEMLRYFLLKSEQNYPLTKDHFLDIISRKDANNDDTLKNTYSQKVRRLRVKLKKVGMDSVIENKPGHYQTAYYYNHRYPYLIIQRSDESFILGE